MVQPARRTRPTLTHLRDESIRRIVASEKVVERQFNEARFVASLAASLLLVGFLLVAQWRGNASFATSLDRQSDQNLGIIIEELTTENSAVRNDIMRLELRIADAQRSTADRSAVLNEAALELADLRAIAGLVAVAGPGVRVVITDAETVLLPQDFVALVSELRSGGAEAISLDGVRIGALTGFSGSPGEIRAGSTVISGDYEILAIGDGSALEQSLAMPGGLKSTLSTFPGVSVRIERFDELTIPAGKQPEFAVGQSHEESK